MKLLRVPKSAEANPGVGSASVLRIKRPARSLHHGVEDLETSDSEFKYPRSWFEEAQALGIEIFGTFYKEQNNLHRFLLEIRENYDIGKLFAIL